MSYTDYSNPSGVDEYQRRQDNDHLNLLAIFYYIMGGLNGLGALGMAAYFVLIGALISTAPGHGGTPPPPHIGGILAGIGGMVFLFMAAYAGITGYAGWCLQQKKNATLIYVAAALNCLHVPLGTALGVFTFIVMSRPSVKALFDGSVATTYAPRQW